MSGIEILKSFYNKGVVLDTNLLILYVFGTCFPDKLEEWKRTQSYTEEDVILLVGILKKFKLIAITPNVLTETSNFIWQLTDMRRDRCAAFLAEQILKFEEHYIESEVAVADPYFKIIGLSDTSILKLTGTDFIALTVDAKLAFHLGNRKSAVVNFNHIRQLRLAA